MQKISPKFDSHMHTPLCGHAIGWPKEYVDAALSQNIGTVTFTCHMPFDHQDFGGDGIRMREAQFNDYLNLIEEAREYGKTHGIEVLTGIEGETVPAPEQMESIQSFLESYPFDFILGSLHHMLPGYRKWLKSNNFLSNTEIVSAYFEQLGTAAESGLYHSLSHPDVIRLYGTLPEPFNPQEHQTDIEKFLDRVFAAKVHLEINTSGLTKGDFEVHPDPIILDWAISRNIPFTIGSDSHLPNSVGQFFDPIYELLQSKGLTHLSYFKKGQPISVPIDTLLQPCEMHS